jgi:hypothetical protein
MPTNSLLILMILSDRTVIYYFSVLFYFCTRYCRCVYTYLKPVSFSLRIARSLINSSRLLVASSRSNISTFRESLIVCKLYFCAYSSLICFWRYFFLLYKKSFLISNRSISRYSFDNLALKSLFRPVKSCSYSTIFSRFYILNSFIYSTF